jgi:sugar transferase EpsL
MNTLAAKRCFDIAVSLLALVLLLPVLTTLALCVALFIGRPAFFVQDRPGLHGRLFRLRKFRTMSDARDASGDLLPDGERMTRFGRLLRSTSLDELPELWNVLVGEMSLVGPRPLLVEYLPLYTALQARRHEVRPGITGWAQVNGRNILSWEERFALDVWYVENRTFALDLKILWLTLQKVWAQEGIAQQGEATMSRFRGSHRS